MAHRLRGKATNSKIYNPNDLSFALNNDHQHQKMWSEKAQQAKHVQQQKQIDRIFFGVVKERMFGKLLSQDARISVEGYYVLDKIGKQGVNSGNSRALSSRKVYPLKNQQAYGKQGSIKTSRFLNKTIDVNEGRSQQYTIENSIQLQSPVRVHRKSSLSLQPGFRVQKRKSLYLSKQISVSRLTNFTNHFRQLAGHSPSMIYEIKITKQMLIKYNKSRDIVTMNCLDRFLSFFNMPAQATYKQYCAWVEAVANCSMSESSFLVFQLLDERSNGFVTISDLFRVLHENPATFSEYLEKEILELMEHIKAKAHNPTMNSRQKPTVEQILVRNRAIKLETLREMLKQSNKEPIETQVLKSTMYHKSLYALEHDPAVREKNIQLEKTADHQKNKSHSQMLIKQDGIKFADYADVFALRRSRFFVLLLHLCTGEPLDLLE